MTSWPDHLPSGNQKRAAGRKAIQRMRREAGDENTSTQGKNLKCSTGGAGRKTKAPPDLFYPPFYPPMKIFGRCVSALEITRFSHFI